METSNGEPALHETFRNRLVYTQRFLKMSVVTLLLSPSLGRGTPEGQGVGRRRNRAKPTSGATRHLLPEEGGRMPPFLHRHFERKREIFFIRDRSGKVRTADNGKHRTPCDVGSRCFMQTALRRKTETGNEKDPSAALEMTKRGNASFHSFSICCGSQPRLAALGSPFQGKGLAWTLPPSYGRRCPEGAEVGWGCRYPTL